MTFDDLLTRLGEALRDEESRKALGRAVLRGIRRGLAGLTVAYAIFLALLAVGFGWVGERNLTLGFLLYVPRQIFLVPLPFLLLVTLPFHWRLIPVQLVAAALFVWFGMGWQFRGTEAWDQPAPAGTITVLTYNRGEHMGQSLQPFKNRTRPDLVVFQEAPNRAAGFARAEGYEEFTHQESQGEFTLLSRFPILSAEPLRVTSMDREVEVAARFMIDLDDRPVAVYAVHFISPRDTLRYYFRGAFLYGVIGLPGTPFNEKRQINQRWWDDRIRQAEQLLERIGAETVPVLVAGDFNAPSGGYIHQTVKRKLGDAHEEAGGGFGFTFPGTTRNPLSRGGPWMRIDYLFSSREWEATACLTEPDRPSQHRAVAARFRLRGSG